LRGCEANPRLARTELPRGGTIEATLDDEVDVRDLVLLEDGLLVRTTVAGHAEVRIAGIAR
jgi:hypothetical protein